MSGVKQGTLDELLRKAGVQPGDNRVIIPGQEQVDPIMEYMGQLTQGIDAAMGQMGTGIQKIGQGLDLTRLQMFMMFKILVDKGICTEEEMKEYYKKEVKEKLQQMQQEMMQKMQEQMQQQAVDQNGEQPNQDTSASKIVDAAGVKVR